MAIISSELFNDCNKFIGIKLSDKDDEVGIEINGQEVWIDRLLFLGQINRMRRCISRYADDAEVKNGES